MAKRREEKIFLSICVPSYNRPKELRRLLDSVDYRGGEKLEIIICEDKSPARKVIRRSVEEFQKMSGYRIRYYENGKNLGYDKNLRELIMYSRGMYIIFMGDDDEFVPGALDHYIPFLREHSDLGYVLKTSRIIHRTGAVEEFRYYPNTTFFDAGFNACVTLFRKSVFISGFTFQRSLAIPYLVPDFDGTLLFQLYLMAEITLKHKSAYCEILLTQQYDEGIPYFGSSESEKNLYTPGSITVDNSINFMKGFFTISGFLDAKYRFNSTDVIKLDFSRYSYPVLSIQRKRGVREFLRYSGRLKELGISKTIHYHLYLTGLLVLGEKNCGRIIQLIKRILGRTPRL